MRTQAVNPPDGRTAPSVRRDQFEVFFRDHHQSAIRYSMRRGLNESDAKEVAADALRIVWQKSPAVDDTALPFLYRTCRNLLVHALRDQQRRTAAETRVQEKLAFETDRAADDDDGHRVREALDALGDPGAELLRLHYWEVLTAAQAAVALNRTEQAVWALASRSRRRLARILEGQTHER